MSRPTEHGPEAEARDVQDIHRILHRVLSSKERSPKEREALADHLRRAAALLMGLPVTQEKRG